MARRTNGTRTASSGRNRTGNGRTLENGKDRASLSVKTNEKGQIFSSIRQKWLAETPEERVRQAYVVTLHEEYGFDLGQMDEELHVAGRGSARARADVVIWRTVQDKADSKAPLIVVECKADMPPGMKAEETCLELYRRFRAKPRSFLLEKPL